MSPATGRAAEFEFGSWSVPGLQAEIEYPLEVMDEIRAFACDELLQLAHGGREVGGVMFGVRRENGIRILTWRPIPCEYIDGDSLHLSATDRLALAVQLERARVDPNLKDLRPVGWFVSHLRQAVQLLPSDRETYAGFFPESWQVTLVLHPTGAGAATAGFFLREADGNLRADASYREFPLKPLQLAPTAPDVVVREPAEPPPIAGEDAAAAHAPNFELGEPVTTKERWLWSIPIVLALVLVGLALYHWKSPAPDRPTSLGVANQASAVQTDSSPKASVEQPPQGNPAGDSAEVIQLRAERDQLASQLRERDEELRKSRARADQLQNLVRILENRLNINGGSQASADK